MAWAAWISSIEELGKAQHMCSHQGGGILKEATALCPLQCGSVPKDIQCPLPSAMRQCTKGDPILSAPYSQAMF